jgi:hypothetical protein
MYDTRLMILGSTGNIFKVNLDSLPAELEVRVFVENEDRQETVLGRENESCNRKGEIKKKRKKT